MGERLTGEESHSFRHGASTCCLVEIEGVLDDCEGDFIDLNR